LPLLFAIALVPAVIKPSASTNFLLSLVAVSISLSLAQLVSTTLTTKHFHTQPSAV
jgi:hypothetical protein